MCFQSAVHEIEIKLKSSKKCRNSESLRCHRYLYSEFPRQGVRIFMSCTNIHYFRFPMKDQHHVHLALQVRSVEEEHQYHVL
jgi:hypothetical protein